MVMLPPLFDVLREHVHEGQISPKRETTSDGEDARQHQVEHDGAAAEQLLSKYETSRSAKNRANAQDATVR
jgi:hypothetical protein